MSRFFDKKFSSLEAYTPGEQPRGRKYIKLNTNESPYPPSPAVLEAVNSSEAAELRLYSDPTLADAKAAIAEFYGVGIENVFVSNGSDESLNFLFMGFCERGAAFADITYGFYKVFAELYGMETSVIPLEDDFTIDISKYAECDKTVFIANPNAPTGLMLSLGEIESLLCQNRDRLVVIDEAYIDFGGESAVALLGKYDNLAVVQTFSKSRQLAGARVGFTIAGADIIAGLEKIKYSTNPYNVNRLSSLAAALAMRDREYFDKTRGMIIETRAYTTESLRKLGFVLDDPMTNFVFARHPDISGGALCRELRDRGILVRHFTSARISDYVRITIGSADEMRELVRAAGEIISEKKQFGDNK